MRASVLIGFRLQCAVSDTKIPLQQFLQLGENFFPLSDLVELYLHHYWIGHVIKIHSHQLGWLLIPFESGEVILIGQSW
mgnify:CR=1 FL=1